MPLNRCYQITDNQRLPSGETIQNVYFYEADASGAIAEELLALFVANMLPDIRGVQSSGLVHFLIECENLGDVGDFDEHQAAGLVGLRPGAVRNEWDCFAYTLRPSIRTVRPGSKRIGGIPEGDAEYTNGVVTDAGMLTLMQALRTEMGTVQAGTGVNYTPVIVKRVLDGATYRLPENDVEYVAVPVAVVLLNTKISHQISRGNNR